MKNEYGDIDRNVARKNKLRHSVETKQDTNKPPLFSWIEFNLSGLCNRVCEFCPRVDPKKFPNLNEHLPIEIYTNVMKDLNKVGFRGGIIYSAFSEPLLYKFLEEVIKITKELCPKTRIEMVTNGDHLTIDKLNKVFAAGLTQISVSLYDGPEQVKLFEDLRVKAGLNKEQFDIRKRYLAREEHFGINLTNRAGANIMNDINVNKLDVALKRRCFYPFYQLMIDYDGAVLLCNHDWHKKLILGNVKETSILDVWNSEKYKEVRGNLANANRNQSPCNRCDANGMMMGEEFVDKWKKYYERKKAVSK
jgi:8-amino-3,8-dideoxy-alpha-D-manno-octulosonate transaminase|tara:strand:- start:859 stop:1776 length:918 start_codon:yes stop_codon:yes gene_type:complete